METKPPLIAVRVFDERFPMGRAVGEPAGVVVAILDTADEYTERFAPRNGTIDPRMRCWRGFPGVAVGQNVRF